MLIQLTASMFGHIFELSFAPLDNDPPEELIHLESDTDITDQPAIGFASRISRDA